VLDRRTSCILAGSTNRDIGLFAVFQYCCVQQVFGPLYTWSLEAYIASISIIPIKHCIYISLTLSEVQVDLPTYPVLSIPHPLPHQLYFPFAPFPPPLHFYENHSSHLHYPILFFLIDFPHLHPLKQSHAFHDGSIPFLSFLLLVEIWSVSRVLRCLVSFWRRLIRLVLVYARYRMGWIMIGIMILFDRSWIREIGRVRIVWFDDPGLNAQRDVIAFVVSENQYGVNDEEGRLTATPPSSMLKSNPRDGSRARPPVDTGCQSLPP
jgi:hypothetical protein